MHVHFLDPYRPRQSPIHRLDPRIKLVLTLAIILTSTLLPTGAWPAYIVLFAGLLSVEIISELGVSYVLKRALLVLPFILAALPLLFTTPGKFIFSLPPGSWVASPTYTGLERMASIAIKSWLSMQAAVVLASATPFPDLLVAMRALGIPRLLVSIFGLMWRYLFVLVDEATRLLRARASRSGESRQPGLKTGGSLTWRAKVTGGMAGSLLLRAFERSDRIYMAMVSRGYDGESRSLPLPKVQPAQWMVLTAALFTLALLVLLSAFLWG